MSPLILDYTGKPRKTAGRNRRFLVTSAKPKDVRRLVDIEFHAFEDERVNQVLSYRDYKKPAHFERSVKLYQTALLQDRESQVQFKKIVNSETNEIISFTKYEMKKYAPQELRSAFDIGHEGEPKMNRDWFGLNEQLRREYVGTQEHCCKLSLQNNFEPYSRY